ncbi:hypothetical protein NC651_012155 [Populus alba x Populus x berolinensis]|nr:hypothetical protein NC651_012155 [Populus alba x Populus x berolinensis]
MVCTTDHTKAKKVKGHASPEYYALKKLLEIEEEMRRSSKGGKRGENTPVGKINNGNGWNHNLLGGGGMSDTLTEGKDSSSNLLRKSSRVLSTRLQKLKMAGSFAKTAMRQIGGTSVQVREERREECGEELCKKRILMGEKCNPLSFSGSLHYDEDGILLPEVHLL